MRRPPWHLSVDQAAYFNTVLVRYADLLDTYLAVGGVCHPADNVGAPLAVAEPCCGEALRAEIIDAVDHLDDIPVAGLTALLGEASPVPVRPRGKRRF